MIMKILSKKYILSASLLMLGGAAMAQNLNSAYFTEGYHYRHNLNPAFGDSCSFISIPALGNISVNTRGNFGYQDVVMKNPMYGQPGQKRMTTFMNPYISTGDALKGFSKGDNKIVGDVNLTILAAGFKAFGGYNTIELSEKTSFGMVLPYELFEFAKNTGNQNYNIGDVSLRARSYAELALGHSHQINEKLRVGAKLKFLLGVGAADVDLKNVQANLAGTDQWTLSGQGTAQVSVKGFTYKSKVSEYNDPNHVSPDGKQGKYEHVDDVDVDGFGLNGFGMALDLGAEYKINDDWRVSAAVMDLGFINWSNNMKAVNAKNQFIFNGFHDTTVGSGSGGTLDDKMDSYGDQLSDFANLKDMGDAGSRSTALAATINLGAEYTLPMYKKLSFGALSSTRLNGSYTWTEGRVSANWKPLRWLDGGVNFAVNSFSTSMGWVLNIHPSGYNLFIGMDHLLGKTSKEFIPLSSNASIAIGMNVAWGGVSQKKLEKESKKKAVAEL